MYIFISRVFVKFFEAKQTQKVNSMKQIIMIILINTYQLLPK